MNENVIKAIFRAFILFKRYYSKLNFKMKFKNKHITRLLQQTFDLLIWKLFYELIWNSLSMQLLTLLYIYKIDFNNFNSVYMKLYFIQERKKYLVEIIINIIDVNSSKTSYITLTTSVFVLYIYFVERSM